MAARYAIYYVPPPEAPLGRFGTSWLGRCADSGDEVAPPDVDGLDVGWLRAVTEAPRLYGWHATLKPPFVLAVGRSEQELDCAVQALAARWSAFEAPPLVLRTLGAFLALSLSSPSPTLDRLAADCVTAVDGFRRPPDEAELDRRRAAGLSARQETMLLRWGYPYVMDEFRFHMTLTDPLDAPASERLERVLRPLVAPFERLPLRVDGLALCRQDESGAKFGVLRRYPLLAQIEESRSTKRGIDSASGSSLANVTTSGPLAT